MADILSAVPVVENHTSVPTAGGFEQAWRYMTDNYTRFQIAAYGSALFHCVSEIRKGRNLFFNIKINTFLLV